MLNKALEVYHLTSISSTSVIGVYFRMFMRIMHSRVESHTKKVHAFEEGVCPHIKSQTETETETVNHKQNMYSNALIVTSATRKPYHKNVDVSKEHH